MNFQPSVFLKTVHNISGGLKVCKTFFRIKQRSITIMSHIFRKLRSIVMSGYKIHRNLLSAAKFHERTNPEFILYPTNGRSAHTKTFIQSLNRIKGFLKKLKILFHICILPEARKIWFVPYLNRPGHHFIRPITFHQVLQGSCHQFTPCLIAFRRRGISLPIKNCLFTGS